MAPFIRAEFIGSPKFDVGDEQAAVAAASGVQAARFPTGLAAGKYVPDATILVTTIIRTLSGVGQLHD